MNENLTYEQRMQAARDRLNACLAPQDARERSIVEWLGKWDEPTLDIVATMVERATQIATAEAYDRGYAEGLES